MVLIGKSGGDFSLPSPIRTGSIQRKIRLDLETPPNLWLRQSNCGFFLRISAWGEA
jgi:hypothetical protein